MYGRAEQMRFGQANLAAMDGLGMALSNAEPC
jgi:hypothetical protein